MDLENDRASTIAVLMDVSASRKSTDEKLTERGVREAGEDIPDGTGIQYAAAMATSLTQLLKSPTWANTLLVSASATVMCEANSKSLRDQLVHLAALCVQWVEIIDERTSKSE